MGKLVGPVRGAGHAAEFFRGFNPLEGGIGDAGHVNAGIFGRIGGQMNGARQVNDVAGIAADALSLLSFQGLAVQGASHEG